ncbi:hypothetical protein HO133_009599 [Letharia lupina]|uniref:Uncharacterized protein n=1 Tax=Letharia lupina TaxID=560253 RepID=A0A8H6CLA9_9LECA|nr:uncharacterized protein HO133_009599 [Letharia lupina]KAF6225599.1 hypothetical protein HO133_009599 [Letharia lupina]
MFVQKFVSLALRLHVLSTIALTASLPAHVFSPALVSSLSLQSNSTLPINITLLDTSSSSSSSSNNLPIDPLLLRTPESTVFLKVHGYGPRLPPQSTYRTLRKAVDDVLSHIREDPSEGKTPMEHLPQGYFYGTFDVELSLRPKEAMTWGMWGDTLRGLRRFGETWEFVGLAFDVLVRGEGEEETKWVGSGQLEGIA